MAPRYALGLPQPLATLVATGRQRVVTVPHNGLEPSEERDLIVCAIQGRLDRRRPPGHELAWARVEQFAHVGSDDLELIFESIVPLPVHPRPWQSEARYGLFLIGAVSSSSSMAIGEGS